MDTLGTTPWRVERRDFLKASALVLAGLSADAVATPAAPVRQLRMGIVGDAHYADAPPRAERHYRESLTKMDECVTAMQREKVDLLVELGDLKDQDEVADEARTLRYLEEIEARVGRFPGPRYHVLGNHDLDSLSKEQFARLAPSTGIDPGQTYYSFDLNGTHMVVLDANFRQDGVAYDHGNFVWTDTHIPPVQLAWLEQDLADTAYPVVGFVHQLLDGDDEFCVKNAAQVRDVLQRSGRVLAVFHGHHHAGRYRQLEGIHYYTLTAMVEGSGLENSAYATVDVFPGGAITVTGYRRAVSRILEKPTDA